MKKKVIGILICMALVLTVLPVSGIIDYNTGYYWKSITENDHTLLADTEDMVGSVGRDNLPPYQPHNESPANGSTGVSINANLSWTGGDPDGDNVTYDVYFGTNSTPPKVVSNQTNTTYDPGTMNHSTTYYWQIIAWDNQSAFNESLLWEFTTEQAAPNQPPYQPSNPNPANGSTNVSLKIDLNWTGGDPDGDNVTYDVYFGTNSTPPKVVSNQTNTTYDPETLDENTTYYWQIIAWDSQNTSNESFLWHFTTGVNHPPYQPHNETPLNGSIPVGINADISWEGGDPDGDPVTYDVYFGDTNPPPQVESNHSETTYELDKLNTSTTYYWKIVAWDDLGLSTNGSIWHFTTQPNEPPYPPIIISGPAFGGPGITLNFSAITSDPEDDEVLYKWDWGNGNQSEWLGPHDISDPVKTSYSWNNSGEYTIKVKAKDHPYGAESGWSDPHNISISKQIEINNLKPGFIYFHIFTFDKSYLYLHAFSVLGITGVISTGSFLLVNATATEAVDSVEFEAFQILWNMTLYEYDNDMSDGVNTLFSLNTGLFRITAYAYDEEGNMIDNDAVDYLLLFCRGKSGGGGMIRRVLVNRLMR